MRKGKDLDPDPHLLLMDSDLEGPKHADPDPQHSLFPERILK
jgi:hypothetical protein